MKTRVPHRILPVVCLMLLTAVVGANAQNATWTNDTGLNIWGDVFNWSPNVVPSSANSIADFSTLDLFGTQEVDLESSRTIGTMLFADQDPTNTPSGWILADAGDTNQVLTFAGTNPTVRVSSLGTNDNSVINSGATGLQIYDVMISANIRGTVGFRKTGPGILRIRREPNQPNLYTGGTRIGNGILRLDGSSFQAQAYVAWLGPTASIISFVNEGTNVGTLMMHGHFGTDNSMTGLSNLIQVLPGQSGVIRLSTRMPAGFGNRTMFSDLNGAGTLTVISTGVREGIHGNWSTFSGLLIMTNANGASNWKFTDNRGYPAARIINTGNVLYAFAQARLVQNPPTTYTADEKNEIITNQFGIMPIIPFGSVSGNSGSMNVDTGDNGASAWVARVGGLNFDDEYGGNIGGAVGIVKDGTGTWTLTGNHANQGGFVISNGVLRFGNRFSTNFVNNQTTTASGTVGQQNNVNNSFTTNANGNISSFITNVHMNAIVNYGTVVFQRASNIYVSNMVFGTGSLVVGGADSYVTTNFLPGPASTVFLAPHGTPLFYTNWFFAPFTNAITGFSTNQVRLIQLAYRHRVDGPLGGTNAYTGRTIVTNFGILVISNETALGAIPTGFSADKLELGSGGVFSNTLSMTLSANRGVTLGAGGGVLKPQSGLTLIVPAIVAGSGGVTVGGGTVGFTGVNTYSGKTAVSNGGTLYISAASGLGTAPGAATADQVSLNGGALSNTAGLTLGTTTGVTLSGNTNAINTAAGTLTVNGPVAGAGDITKGGPGTLSLGGTNTYSGKTTNALGTLALGANGSISNTSLIWLGSNTVLDVSAVSGGFSLNGAAFQTLMGNGIVTGNVTAVTGDSINPGASVGSLSFSNNLTLSGGTTNSFEFGVATNDNIRVQGNLTLSGLNWIKLDVGSPLAAGSYTLIRYGGTLSGGSANLKSFNYPRTRQTVEELNFATANQVDFVLSGVSPSSLVWAGGLAGNAWDWNTTFNWSANTEKFFDFDAVRFDQVGVANSPVNITETLVPGNVTVSNDVLAGPYVFSGAGKLRGGYTLIKQGGDLLNILTLNESTGPTLISNGTVRLGDNSSSGNLGTGAITNVSSSPLTLWIPDTQTIAGGIHGPGGLLNQSVGTVILTGTNTFSGITTNIGTLIIGNGGTSGQLGTGGVTNDGSLIFNRSGVLTNATPITGLGSVTKQGAGRVVLAANNNWDGLTTVEAGVLQIGAGGGTGTPGNVNDITVETNAQLVIDRTGTLTISRQISGGGVLQVGNPSAGPIVQLTVSNFNFGGTVISNGTIELGDGTTNNFNQGTLGDGPVTNNGTIHVRYGNYIEGDGFETNDMVNDVAIANRLFGTGRLILSGASANRAFQTNGGRIWIDPDVNDSAMLGGVIIQSNAIVRIGSDGASPVAFGRGAATTAIVTFTNGGGVIEYNGFANGAGAATIPYIFSVAAGTTGRIFTPNTVGAGGASGAQTAGVGISNLIGPASAVFEIQVSGTRGSFANAGNGAGVIASAHWSNFFGLIVITPRLDAARFRLNSQFGLPSSKVRLSTNSVVVPDPNDTTNDPPLNITNLTYAWLNYPDNTGLTALAPVPIGELTGEPGNRISVDAQNDGARVRWALGTLNTDFELKSSIHDVGSFRGTLGIIKAGTLPAPGSKMTLSGTNHWGDALIISNGVVRFVGLNTGTTTNDASTNGWAFGPLSTNVSLWDLSDSNSVLDLTGLTNDAGVADATLIMPGASGATTGFGLNPFSTSTLRGRGKVFGSVWTYPAIDNVTNVIYANIAPGEPQIAASNSYVTIGQLTFTNALVMTNGGANVIMELVRSNVVSQPDFPSPNSDRIRATNIVYGGTLDIRNAGFGAANVLTNGNFFKLFSWSGTRSGSFTNIIFPPLIPGLGWTNGLNVDGQIGVTGAVTTLTAPAPYVTNTLTSTNTVVVQWNSTYTGWRLEIQTNTTSVGVKLGATNWFSVPASETTNQQVLNLNLGNNICLYYRLAFP